MQKIKRRQRTAGSPFALMVGASFTAVTVSRKGSAADAEPSLTVTVMVAEPDWLAAGVTVIVRLAPLPPSTSLPTEPGSDSRTSP